ncbi:MAG: ShlB/FhaC/HecB family hemolysin secretion/activation protein [Candidatus Omnitrophica bacterium]|nr:ShlB/FhaC/HecB family hemolysin secretion/activation protein [Candidatus Omnitrophota bacterium]
MGFRRISTKMIGELLLERHAITPQQLDKALQFQKENGGYLSQSLISLGFTKEEDIANCLAVQYDFAYIELDNYSIPDEVLKSIPLQFINIYSLLPVYKKMNCLTVVMADPLNDGVIDMLKQITKCEIIAAISTYSQIRRSINKYFGEELNKIVSKVDGIDLLKENIADSYVQVKGYEGRGRRKFKRLDVDLDMAYFLGKNMFSAKIKNIGLGGLAFVGDLYLPIDQTLYTTIACKLALKKLIINTVVQIVRLEKIREVEMVDSCEITRWKYKFAGFFSFIADDEKQKLATFLKENIKNNNQKLIRLFLIFFLFLFSVSPALFAQTPPPGQDVGAQGERFKSDIQLQKERVERKETKAPKIEIEEPKVEKPTVSEAVSFELKDVVITGATIFKPEDFRPIYQQFINKKVNFKDIEFIIEKIKAKYKKEGYLTTTVYLPEQDIKEGRIEIRVAEGRMGHLTIEGNKWFSSELIEKYFHVKKNEILNINKLQRDALRLNRNSDLEVKTIISPGKEALASDITLKIKDKFPWHFGISSDNQGTRLTGKYRGLFSLRSTNVSGAGDSLYWSNLFNSRTFGESFSYNHPIGTYGTKFGIDFTYFDMKLWKEYKSFDITGNSQIYTPHINWELALKDNFESYLNLGMDFKSIKKHTLGVITASDQLRTPFFGFNFSKTDAFGGGGQTSFNPKFNFSTSSFLGASHRNHPTSSRAGTGGFFFKYEQSISRIQKLPFGSYCLLRSQFQIPSHTLPSVEQFQLGGANSVRGYPEGDYLADIGGNLNFDWVFPNYLIPKDWKLKYSDLPLQRQIEPVVFIDMGGGQLKKVIPGEKYKRFLVGVGGGLRIHLLNTLFARLEWARRIGDRPTSSSGPSTFHLTFQSEF